MAKGGSKSGGTRGGTRTIHRSASTGKFVKKSTVERHPDKTVTEKR